MLDAEQTARARDELPYPTFFPSLMVIMLQTEASRLRSRGFLQKQTVGPCHSSINNHHGRGITSVDLHVTCIINHFGPTPRSDNFMSR